jgi:hypothetical protein
VFGAVTEVSVGGMGPIARWRQECPTAHGDGRILFTCAFLRLGGRAEKEAALESFFSLGGRAVVRRALFFFNGTASRQAPRAAFRASPPPVLRCTGNSRTQTEGH